MSESAADPGTIGAIGTERDGPVAVLILDRPGKLNAITPDMTAALTGALDSAEADEGVRAIVVAGTGRAFSAGFDLEAGEWDSLDKIRDLAAGMANSTPMIDETNRVVLRESSFDCLLEFII